MLLLVKNEQLYGMSSEDRQPFPDMMFLTQNLNITLTFSSKTWE